ncbi:MAG: hypothetical protein CMP11_07970 [Zetaproteobacteria bacterium]|nr:hypothetical protein [Pseudobdellovibrionaceae bacterium]
MTMKKIHQTSYTTYLSLFILFFTYYILMSKLNINESGIFSHLTMKNFTTNNYFFLTIGPIKKTIVRLSHFLHILGAILSFKISGDIRSYLFLFFFSIISLLILFS